MPFTRLFIQGGDGTSTIGVSGGVTTKSLVLPDCLGRDGMKRMHVFAHLSITVSVKERCAILRWDTIVSGASGARTMAKRVFHTVLQD